MFRLNQIALFTGRTLATECKCCAKNSTIIIQRSKTTDFSKSFSPRKSLEHDGPLKWVLLVMPVAAFGLGCWQTKRLQWKLDLIKSLKGKTTSAPADLPENLADLSGHDYCPFKVKGHFLHDKEILIGPRALIESEGEQRSGSLVSDPNKNQGWLVITPFQLHGRPERILINRGWIPRSMKNPETRPEGQITGEVELTGILKPGEKRPTFVPANKPQQGQWFYRDLEQMAGPSDSALVWLDARGIPDPPKGWPLPNQTRVTLRNEHLSYLITWFGLSGCTAYMWLRLFVQKLPLL